MSTGKQLSHIMEIPLGWDRTTHNHKNISQTASRTWDCGSEKQKDSILQGPYSSTGLRQTMLKPDPGASWMCTLRAEHSDPTPIVAAGVGLTWGHLCRQFQSSLQECRGLVLFLLCKPLHLLPFLCVECYPVWISEKVLLNKPGIVEGHKRDRGVTLVATFLARDKYFSPKWILILWKPHNQLHAHNTFISVFWTAFKDIAES